MQNPPKAGFAWHTSRRDELFQMRGDEFRHLEHSHLVLSEDGAKLIVSEDISLVLRVLKIVLLDVFPKLLNDFRSRERG